MIETEGELLELFDGLDEAGRLMALPACWQIARMHALQALVRRC